MLCCPFWSCLKDRYMVYRSWHTRMAFSSKKYGFQKEPSFLENMILHIQIFFSLGKRERVSQVCLWCTRSCFVKFLNIIRFFSAISSWFNKEIFFIVRTVIHCNNIPRDLVEFSHWRFSKMHLDRVSHNLIYTPFPKNVGNQMIFWGPFQPVLFSYYRINNKLF